VDANVEIGIDTVIGPFAQITGGTVIGVIPTRLVELEVAHAGLTKLHVVETMHQRKALMAEWAWAMCEGSGIVVFRGAFADLAAVDGVGPSRAKDIREGLRRLQEVDLVDRYLQS